MPIDHIGNFVLDEGKDAYGVNTEVRFEGDQVVKVQSYDAEPLLEQCAAERKATSGERWGEMRKVGSIPPHIYAKFLTMTDNKERQKMIRSWLMQNKAFISFDKYAL